MERQIDDYSYQATLNDNAYLVGAENVQFLDDEKCYKGTVYLDKLVLQNSKKWRPTFSKPLRIKKVSKIKPKREVEVKNFPLEKASKYKLEAFQIFVNCLSSKDMTLEELRLFNPLYEHYREEFRKEF